MRRYSQRRMIIRIGCEASMKRRKWSISSEPGVHDPAARYLHLAIEVMIDLVNRMIAAHNPGTPDSNRDAFTALEEKAGKTGGALVPRGVFTMTDAGTARRLTATKKRRRGGGRRHVHRDQGPPRNRLAASAGFSWQRSRHRKC